MTGPGPRASGDSEDVLVAKDADYYREIRQAMGHGSRSLFFGTSSKALDSAVETLQAVRVSEKDISQEKTNNITTEEHTRYAPGTRIILHASRSGRSSRWLRWLAVGVAVLVAALLIGFLLSKVHLSTSSSYSYPALDVFWTISMVFLCLIWFWVLITIFTDLFRSYDLFGLAKALWFIFILFLPLIGILVYLIARGSNMHERAQRDALQDQQFRQYVQEAAGPGDRTADQLSKLADLRDRGVITADEFESQKAKFLV